MSGYTIFQYLRLSSEDKDIRQAGKTESNSIGNQRNLLNAFISRTPEFAGAQVVEFCDDGWSGKNFDRPAVKAMLEQVRRGKAQCVMVKDLSRFGRDYLTVGNYITRVFPFLNVRFIAVNDGFDSSRPQDIGNLESSFKTLLNDYYSRELSRKVRSAKQLRAQRGCFLSPFAPYGYDKDPTDKNRLVIDPGAAATVRRIFHMTANGCSAVEVAKALNDDCVLTPMLYKRAAGCTRTLWPSVANDNFWTGGTVMKILRDERYIGKTVYGKRTRNRVGHAHTSKVSSSNWISADGTHEAIVTREEFNKAQHKLREFSEHSSAPCAKTPFSKKVRCGVCGHCMERVRAKQPYYVCRTSRVTDLYPCSQQRILQSELMDALLDALRVQTLCTVEAERIWEAQNVQYRCNADAMRDTLAHLHKTHSQFTRHIRELYESFALGAMDKTSYLVAKNCAVQKRDAAAARIREIEAELDNAGVSNGPYYSLVNPACRYEQVEQIAVEIVTDVLHQIVVYPDHRLHIVWNYREY